MMGYPSVVSSLWRRRRRSWRHRFWREFAHDPLAVNSGISFAQVGLTRRSYWVYAICLRDLLARQRFEEGRMALSGAKGLFGTRHPPVIGTRQTRAADTETGSHEVRCLLEGNVVFASEKARDSRPSGILLCARS